jgi:hypothetical protein
VKDPLAEGRRVLEEATLGGPGKTPSTLRRAVAKGPGTAEIPAELRVLVEKIERHAYRVTDEDIVGLKAKYSEDELFEIVVSTALGAALRRLDAGLLALDAAADPTKERKP